jgi:hypothetical protein
MTTRHPHRRLVTVAAVTILAACGIWVWPSATRHASPVGRPPVAAGMVSPVSVVLAGSLVWRRWIDSVWLPYSPVDGPQVEADGVVSGFSRTELGAGLAAVHLSTRSTHYAGPLVFDATIDRQLTGRFRESLRAAVHADYEAARVRLHLEKGASVPFQGSVPTCFHTTFTSGSDASVDVVWVSGGKFYVASYRLVWIDDDWRLLAEDPTATANVPVFTAMPAGYRLFPGVGGL